MADHGDGAVQSKRNRTVIVRHLPADLAREEKEDLLKYFGAVAVRVMSDRGALVSQVTTCHFKEFSAIVP